MKTIFILFFLTVSLGHSQKKDVTKLGQVTMAELQMSRCAIDSKASALVLEENAYTYLSEKHNLDFKTDYYHRIKLFNRQSFDKATIEIQLYDQQKSDDIEAYSYHLENGKIIMTKLEKSQIFKKNIHKKWKEVVFTIPNLKEGSVIEYKYSVISPYPSINDWYFQSDIPKLKSDYTFSYLGNYKYNVRLVGFLKLDRKVTKVKKRCVMVPGIGRRGQSGYLSYGIDNIPAFKEEDYMLSKENFISKIVFDLISITRTDGVVTKYTQTWKDADKNFQKNWFDNQTNKEKFFKRRLPDSLLSVVNPVEKATGIFKFIQGRFTWNQRYWTQGSINLKEAFERRSGGVDVINLSLYNSLQAAGIECYIMTIATRENGLPTKLYPVTRDFNYIIVTTVLNGERYFLDATDKFMPFGQIPMRCLNGEGRVLDFDKGSYWETINPISNNIAKISVQLTLDEDNELTGKIHVQKKGYLASNNRKLLSVESEEDYLRDLESKMTDYEIEDYLSSNLKDLEAPLLESFTINPYEVIFDEDIVRINPFFYYQIQTNPFKLKERKYPVDYGYPRTYSYRITMDVPKGYKVISSPQAKAIGLPNKAGKFVLRSLVSDKKISLNYRFKIKKKVFTSQEYFYLKEFFNQTIKVYATPVEFQKI